MNSILKLTPRAQQALAIARQEAERLEQTAIGTEHLLLAFMKIPQCIAISILRAMGVDIEQIKNDVEKSSTKQNVSKNPKNSDGDGIELSSAVQRVLVSAAKEANMLQHPYIGTEHILLGILKEGDSVASNLLTEQGIKLEACRQSILSALDPNFASMDDTNVSTEDSDKDDEEPSSADNNDDQKQGSTTKTPALRAFGRDLTAMARDGVLDPVVGREKEITRVLQILCRRTKNNPVLVGEAGVGKTAIVEGLAQAIASNKVPDVLSNKRVISLDVALMLAGTKYRGQFEERIKAVMDDIHRAKNIILFLDELHTIVGTGSSEGSMDASNIFKPALSRGEIQCIGATTLDEYRKYIEKDSALERRFQPVTVEPPSIDDAIKILHGVKKCYEDHHHVKYTDEAIKSAVTLSVRYIQDRFLPDKAIDVLDEAGARTKLKKTRQSPRIEKLLKQIGDVRAAKEEAAEQQDFENAAKLRDQEKKLLSEKDAIQSKLNKNRKFVTVDEDEVMQVISSWSGVPMTRLEKQETERLLTLSDTLKKSVIGQDDAVDAVSRAIRRARTDLNDPNKPIGSFLFLGPTGVGKTHLAKMLAEQIFGNKDAVIQVDMSEYMEKHSISRMVGSPPGYVGHEEGGQLTEMIRRKPYSVILFDEIEKAHPDVLQILLQVLGDGHLTDGQGRKIDFKNTILILTSNVGSEIMQKDMSLGFNISDRANSDFEKIKISMVDEAKKSFKPEFLNRLTDTIVFRQLDKDAILKIVDIELAKVTKRLSSNGIAVKFDDTVRQFLAKRGYDKKLGARPLSREIEKNIEDKLSDRLLTGEVFNGAKVSISWKDSEPELSFTIAGEKVEIGQKKRKRT